MADERETWEVQITVPPVTEEVKVLRVRCGLTVAEVREAADSGSWHAVERNSPVQPIRQDDYPAAVADARRIALGEERRRLLDIALTEAVQAEDDDAGAGEVSRG